MLGSWFPCALGQPDTIGGRALTCAATVKFGCHSHDSLRANPEATGSPMTRSPRWRARATCIAGDEG
jgi:hypothetical protein